MVSIILNVIIIVTVKKEINFLKHFFHAPHCTPFNKISNKLGKFRTPFLGQPLDI